VQRAHTQEEIAELLAQAGFLIEGVFDAFTKEAPTATSERVQFVARKE